MPKILFITKHIYRLFYCNWFVRKMGQRPKVCTLTEIRKKKNDSTLVVERTCVPFSYFLWPRFSCDRFRNFYFVFLFLFGTKWILSPVFWMHKDIRFTLRIVLWLRIERLCYCRFFYWKMKPFEEIMKFVFCNEIESIRLVMNKRSK